MPVVCVIGTGKPTHVGFGYRQPWPKNLDEDPCPLRFEDGDITVPARSSESVCMHWARQKRCKTPLGTAHATRYRGRSDECVETVHMHCRAANMESVDEARGKDHCKRCALDH